VAREPFGLTGQLIDGQFRVERAIGEGGFSVVYRGMHAGLGEPIAIKCLKLTATLDGESIETFTRRFRDEGRLLYRLGQGNLDIVRCIMSGTTVSPVSGALVPYMVLEWLEGRSLAADLKMRREQQQLRGRSLEEMVALFDPGATALEYAHQQGVVHRDVKPGNLFLVASKSGQTRMKVLDFGLAKILDETIGITLAATVGSFMMCSPRYAAPEQFDPKIGPIGPWTDVYSLALVLLEVLRDQKVRKSDGLIACMAQAVDPTTDLSAKALGMQLPPRIEAALARAVTMDPRARQRSAGELWDEIKTAMRERAPSPWSAPPPGAELSGPAPASASPDTLVDPVFSVPTPSDSPGAPPRQPAPRDARGPAAQETRPAAGGTLMMRDAPLRPGSSGSTPAPPRAAYTSSYPPPFPGPPPYPPAGFAPMPSYSPSHPPAARARSRAPVVVFLVLIILAVLGTAGFLRWRARKAARVASLQANLPRVVLVERLAPSRIHGSREAGWNSNVSPLP
jgi:serine/threonine protein kinase